MAYSGKYKVKNIGKYQGDPDKVTYRSSWEKACFIWCDANPKIKYWSSEEVVVPYKWDIDKKMHRYFVDLKITFNDGKTILVEIKPNKETAPPKRPVLPPFVNGSTRSITLMPVSNSSVLVDKSSSAGASR